MKISEFQKLIETQYLARDRDRGIDATFRWFVEEVGELAKALRNIAAAKAKACSEGTADDETAPARANLEEELGDVLAWLVTIASLVEVDLERVAEERYGSGCPKCGATPCRCPKA